LGEAEITGETDRPARHSAARCRPGTRRAERAAGVRRGRGGGRWRRVRGASGFV